VPQHRSSKRYRRDDANLGLSRPRLGIPSWVSNSIADRVVADSDLSTLLAHVSIAELGGALPGPGEVTLVDLSTAPLPSFLHPPLHSSRVLL
jgi:hypothetical protein